MYMPNVSPNARIPNATYITLTCLGVSCWGYRTFRVHVWDNANFSVFRYQHVGIPNVKFRFGGLSQREDPTRMFSLCSGI